MTGRGRAERLLPPRRFMAWRLAFLFVAAVLFSSPPAPAQEACADCHDDVQVSLPPHDELACADCHDGISEYPHPDPLPKVDCSSCHDGEAEQHRLGVHARLVGGAPAAACADCHRPHEAKRAADALAACAACHSQVVEQQHSSLHGQAAARGDRLAPTCVTCHGPHAILPHTDPKSPVAVMNVPLLCGRCHKAGTEVTLFRDIPQQDILEHYRDSIHGAGLYEKGLTVTAVCTSCHTSHAILPHTDSRSSIAAANVASTCKQCHAQIEQVHRKVIAGRLWKEAPNRIPVCVDCHQPHEIRKVFYTAGMANQDCLTCHGKVDLAVERDGRRLSLYVDGGHFAGSAHAKVSCAQCHTEVQPSRVSAVRDGEVEGRLLDLPRRAGRPVPRLDPRPPRRPGRR